MVEINFCILHYYLCNSQFHGSKKTKGEENYSKDNKEEEDNKATKIVYSKKHLRGVFCFHRSDILNVNNFSIMETRHYVGVISVLMAMFIVGAIAVTLKSNAEDQREKQKIVNQFLKDTLETKEILEGEWEAYRNNALGFSLTIPTGIEIAEINDATSKLVAFQGKGLDFTLKKVTSDVVLDNFEYSGFSAIATTTIGTLPVAVFVSPQDAVTTLIDPFIAFTSKKGTSFYTVVFNGDIELDEAEAEILASFKII